MENIPKMNDDNEAEALIANSPDITKGEMERAIKEQGQAPETPASGSAPVTVPTPEVDERLADLAGRSISEVLNGFGVESSPTVSDLSGTLVADVATLLPAGHNRMGRIVTIGALLALVVTPPLLRVFGVIGEGSKDEAPPPPQSPVAAPQGGEYA